MMGNLTFVSCKLFHSPTWNIPPGDINNGNRLKALDKKPPGKEPPGQKPPDNKPPRINKEIIEIYAVDANLFQVGSTNL